jgi:hypothetical protein
MTQTRSQDVPAEAIQTMMMTKKKHFGQMPFPLARFSVLFVLSHVPYYSFKKTHKVPTYRMISEMNGS